MDKTGDRTREDVRRSHPVQMFLTGRVSVKRAVMTRKIKRIDIPHGGGDFLDGKVGAAQVEPGRTHAQVCQVSTGAHPHLPVKGASEVVTTNPDPIVQPTHRARLGKVVGEPRHCLTHRALGPCRPFTRRADMDE